MKLFLTALMFYTRIPVPKNIDHSSEMLNKATRYFTLIGLIVGALIGLVYYGTALLFSHEIAICLALVSGILITGAFHEDGLADVCDSFGGGYSVLQKLNIMKDSRVGTYGVIALVLALLLKFLILSEIKIYLVEFFVIMHTLSRLSPVIIIMSSKYVREDELSKVKPIGKRLTIPEFVIAFIIGVSPTLLIGFDGLYLIAPMLISTIFCRWLFIRHLGGYTGDCLGAAQQITELVLYASSLLVCAYIL